VLDYILFISIITYDATWVSHLKVCKTTTTVRNFEVIYRKFKR